MDIISECLQLWPKSVDISDGELKSDNGFYSPNLSTAWWDAEDKTITGSDLDFMVWAIFGVLHKLAREKFIEKKYVVLICELNHDDIMQEYIKAKKEAGM